MNPRRRVVTVGLVLVLLGACGGSADGGGAGLPSDSRPTGQAPSPGEPRRSGVAVATIGDGTLVVGGIEGDGTIIRQGVLVGADGERSTFDLGVPLVDLSIAVAADQVYVAGRACADDAEATDLGVECDQQGPVVLRVDPVSGTVEPIAENEMAAASPRATVQLFAWDDRVVVQVQEDAATRLFAIDPAVDPAGSNADPEADPNKEPDVTTTPLPSPPETGITCATATALYSGLPSQVGAMTDADADDADADADGADADGADGADADGAEADDADADADDAEADDADADSADDADGAEISRGAGLVRLGPEDSRWTEVEAPAGGHRWSVRACSSTHLVEIPGTGPVTSVLVLDDRSTWQTIELPEGDAFRTPVVLTNPAVPSFVLADSGTWVDVDPGAGAGLAGRAEMIDTGARAVMPGPTTFLTAAGAVRDVTDEGEVGPLW